MELYLDTASVTEISEIARWGILAGVTTNPSLLARESGDPARIIRQIGGIVRGPVSCEVLATAAPEMVREARKLAAISRYVVVKIPCTPDGIKATVELSRRRIPVNMTLVFSPAQALLAARAGAAYASPFVGRLDDAGHSGTDVVREIVEIYRRYSFRTRIIFASVRHPRHVVEAALLGVDICTIPYKIFLALVRHPLTDVGIARFLADWSARA